MTAAPPPLLGGQAVIEGVMMRSPRWTSTAVRLPGGEIAAFTSRADSLLLRRRWLRAPVVRGAVVLYEALALSIRALVLSANAVRGEAQRMSPRQVGLSVGAGLGVAVGVFFLLPAVLAHLLDPYLAGAVASNLAEGAVRVALLVGYLAAIGRVPDIARVFAYHGAEHKAVNAYEAGAPLRPAAVRAHSRFHPRCGTSFLLVVMIAAIAVFALLGRPPLLPRLLGRVALIPLVAGLSYEGVRAGARSRWVRPLVVPGLWLQRLTTREPDDAQIEVAVRALREVVERERGGPDIMGVP